MHKMMYKKEELYLTTRNSIFYFVRRVPRDLIQYYSSNRISFSLKTKSKLKALTRQDPSLYRQTLRKDPFLDNKTNDKPDLPITKAPITPPPKKTPPSKPNHCSQPDSSSA